MIRVEVIDELMYRGLEDGVYPGAAISIGDKSGELFRKVYGHRQILPEKKPMEKDTLFDIASLTKITSTTMVALKLIEERKLSLNNTLGSFFETPKDKGNISIFHLMTHLSGLAAHDQIYNLVKGPDDVVSHILDMDLLNTPGKAVVYSCLGYILLGKICEAAGNNTLDKLAKQCVFDPLGLKSAGYNPTQGNNSGYTFAVTEFDNKTGTWLEGVVHDENARFLGGVSGNAGVFANIEDMAGFALMFSGKGRTKSGSIISESLFEEALKNHSPHCEEGRGLGFAVKAAMPVSCGSIFPVGSYGHTGFTGTSLWVDAETSQYVVFMTNRVHPTRENEKHIPFRREIHDLCAKEYRKL